MKRFLFLAAMGLISALAAFAQESFVKQKFDRIARNAIIDEIANWDARSIEYAGVVIVEVSSGKVIANVALNGMQQNIPNGNRNYYPTGLARSVLFLTCVPEVDPNTVIDTGNGYYQDQDSAIIIDESRTRGGYGKINLMQGVDRSNVCMLKCVETYFHRNTNLLSEALNRTGILFGGRSYGGGMWRSQEIIGYHSPMTLIQMTAWSNAVANGGRILLRFDTSDPTEPIDSITSPGLEYLKTAWREAVETGLTSKMRNNLVEVAGITNRTPEPDADQKYGLFATAFFPAKAPRYTIGCYVSKKNTPAGRAIPSRIVGKIIDRIVHEILYPVKPQDLERQREYTIQQFKQKVGVPLLVPFIYESTPAWHLYVTTKDSTDMKVNGVYLVDANHDDFDFDKDVYVLDSILVFNHKVGCTYKAMVSGLKNSVHKEVEIDGYMQHTISKINKGTWDYDSNIQIPIIIMRDEEEKKEENPDAPPHETQKE